MLRKLWSLIEHPKTGLLIGLIGVILTTIFYYESISRVELQYAISEPELIVPKSVRNSDFKIIWKNKEIKNLASVKVALWNSGKDYFDNDRIDEPITIIHVEDDTCNEISILSTEPKSSRENLDFNVSPQEQKVLIEIANNDSVDQDDGIVIKLFYEGTDACKFNLTGKIKGTKEFNKVDWNNVVGGNENIGFKIQIFLVCIILILFLIYFLIEFFSSYRSLSTGTPKPIVNFSLAVGLLAITLTTLSIIFGLYIIPEINRFFTPSWIR